MKNCFVCLRTTDDGDYHPSCARRLFRRTTPPGIDVDIARLHALASAMSTHTSISGTQRKISLGFGRDRATLRVPDIGGEYILKPETGVYPDLPANEHVTMLLAAEFGLEVPASGLVRLLDGSLGFLVRRFDRPAAGGKLRQEDFCQLAGKYSKEKYEGTAELCVELVERYSSQPGIDAIRLLRQFVFSWWVGNGDLHLKNFSLLAGASGEHRLSPAYDLVSTRLVIPDDRMALPVRTVQDNITRQVWEDLAGYAVVPPAAARGILRAPSRLLARATALVEASYLPTEMRREYRELLTQRAAMLAA
ncbi:MAG: HipA domain-containing protein [Chloroflexota bacterium]